MADTSGGGSSGDTAEIHAENRRLRDQLLHMLRIEADLFQRNEQLDAQWKIYQALSDLGKRFHGRLAEAEIAAAVVHFALYTLNLERAVLQIERGGVYRTLAADGYYDDVQARAIAALSPAPGGDLFAGLTPGEAAHLFPLRRGPRERDAIGRTFDLDEYALLPFPGGDGPGITAYLIAGNTTRKAQHHSRILANLPVVLALQNLVDLASAALRSARLDAALAAERADLEARVKERTAELTEVNDRLVVELAERQRAERARAELADQVFLAQEERLQELSTPLLPITEDVLVMPLIGTLDEARAEQAQRAALEGASTRGAKVMIMDITGVRAVDESVARSLVRTAAGLSLLGVHVVITGLRAEVARALVELGSDLGTVVTRSTLRSGFTYALAHCRANG